MPPKTAGAGGRKPMKTALISSSAPNHGDVDAGATATAATTTETMTTETETETMTVAAKESAAAATNILDKISRDCSSEELKYLIGLSILEQKVCLIAQDHLESSFDLGRSSGFIAWKKNNGQLQGSVLQ